jgi:hypothetical protein
MNISGIKQIVYQPKIFSIWSLFILFHLIKHPIVHIKTNTAITYPLAFALIIRSDEDKKVSKHLTTGQNLFSSLKRMGGFLKPNKNDASTKIAGTNFISILRS